ncbi:MAG: MmcQ/YjbR family DNA-binding protein [Acidimicrobiales bacterium]
MAEAEIEERIRRICMALPGVTERLSHGAPAFYVGKQFVMRWPHGHHDHEFAHLWCAAPPGAQDELVSTEPDRFFRPPYVGGRGWLGVRLDGNADGRELTAICEEAFRAVAPQRLIAQLDTKS